MNRRMLLVCLLALLLGSSAWAQPVLKLPVEVKGEPATFIRIAANTDCKELRWFSPDPGLAVFPVDLLKNSLTAVVTSARPGRYRLYAYGAKGDVPSEVAIVVVVIGDTPPTPIPPGPDPGPIPPSDPLFNQLQTTYRGVASEENYRLLKLLAAGYQQAAKMARESQQPTVDLMFADIREGFRRLLPSGEAILPVRKLLEAELGKHVKPVVGMPLTDEVRAAYVRQFERYATLLEAIKP